MENKKSHSDQLLFLYLITLFCLTNCSLTYAKDARELVFQNRLQVNLVKTSYSKVKIKTCKYRMKNKKIRCVEKNG